MDLPFVSLYTGCGGLDLGLAKAGMRPAWANEIDPYAVATYDRISKVRDPEWREAAALFEGHQAVQGDILGLVPRIPRDGVAVVAGGPPCQGFSRAGKMDPDDPRAQHVHTFMDVVAQLKPRAFILENVAHLAHSPRWAMVKKRLLDAAWEQGYRTLLTVLDAADYGVPQYRERMFMIGLGPDVKADLTELHHLLVEPTLGYHPQSAGGVLRTLPPAGQPGNEQLCKAKVTLARKPVLRRSPFAGMLFNGQGRPVNLARPAPTLPATMGGNRTPVVDLGQLERGATPWVVGYHARLWREKLPPLDALPASARMRRLTVEEAAALQSFPRDMDWQGPQTKRFSQIGNAVPPRLAWFVGQAVAAVLTREPREAQFWPDGKPVTPWADPWHDVRADVQDAMNKME